VVVVWFWFWSGSVWLECIRFGSWLVLFVRCGSIPGWFARCP
jgi:hypothetical protein